MELLTKASKSRTVQFAALLAALSVLQGSVLLIPVSPMAQMFINLGLAVAIVVLRAITKEPLSAK